GFNELAPRDPVLLVPAVDAHGAVDLDEASLGGAPSGDLGGWTQVAKDAEALPDAKVHSLVHQHVDRGALAEHHPVLTGADQLSPNVPLRVADVALIAKEDRPRRNSLAAAEPRAETALTGAGRGDRCKGLSSRRRGSQLISGIDPMW